MREGGAERTESRALPLASSVVLVWGRVRLRVGHVVVWFVCSPPSEKSPSLVRGIIFPGRMNTTTTTVLPSSSIDSLQHEKAPRGNQEKELERLGCCYITRLVCCVNV